VKTRGKTKKRYSKKSKKSGNSSSNRFLRWIASGFFRLSLIIGVMAVLSGTFIFIYNYLYNSPYLKLQKIVVEGVNDAIKNEIIHLAGLAVDMSIVGINLDEVRYAIEEHPWIRSTKIRRKFPNSIVIQAEKQEAVAVIVAKKMYYLNGYGEVFKQLEDSEFVDLPVLTGISDKGSPAEDDIRLACKIIKFFKEQKRPFSLMELSEIHFREDGGVSIYFDKMPIEIKTEWVAIENKIDSLRKVIAHLNSTGRIGQVEEIDLNYSSGIMVSFKDG